MESLRQKYCPPLDEALFFALVLDYDLEDPSQLSALRQILDSLKNDAVEEQELELLPPAPVAQLPHISSRHPTELGDASTEASFPRNARSAVRSTSDEDATTSVSTGLTELALSEGLTHGLEQSPWDYSGTGKPFEQLSEEGKVQWLNSMFPAVNDKVIRSILTKSQGKFEQSTDELLNLSFLNDNDISDEVDKHSPAIGIEGFAVSDNESQFRRKMKNKKRRNRNQTDNMENASMWSSESDQTSRAAMPDTNAWKSASHDIDFIDSRTYLKKKYIASVYHANGARLPLTIQALISAEGAKHSRSMKQEDEVLQWQLDELHDYFPQLSLDIIHGALELARKIPSAAKDLLEIMLQSDGQPVVLGKLTGVGTYAPLNLSDEEEKRVEKHRSGTLWPATVSDTNHTITHMSNGHGTAASRAFEQATAAHRKSKSDRLMGGAAAYYASIGQDHVRAAKALQAGAADAHVARQSTSTTLDLHGVNVSHAMRIAQHRTEAWWDDLGDRKYVPVGGVGNGFKIITGVGRHSVDGISKIGPAVSKMLVREGWKVEVGRGEIIVWGRARRK